jgi:hypothetical protein
VIREAVLKSRQYRSQVSVIARDRDDPAATPAPKSAPESLEGLRDALGRSFRVQFDHHENRCTPTPNVPSRLRLKRRH